MVSYIAIAGISSKLALEISKNLLKKRPDICLRGSCRDINKLPPWLRNSDQVTLIQTGPYEKDALRSLIKGCDVLICCYLADNETMLDGQKLLIDLCEEGGVPRYIASDYTADYRMLEYGDVVIKDPMKSIMAYLGTKSKVKGVHVLVGLFMESYWDLFGYWNAQEKTLSYWGTGNEKWEFTSCQTTGQYVAAIAVDEKAVGVLKFLSQIRSTAELADDVEAVHGFRPTLKQLGSLDDLQKRVEAQGKEQQNPLEAGAFTMLSGKWPVGAGGVDNERYSDIKPETFQDFLERRKAAS